MKTTLTVTGDAAVLALMEKLRDLPELALIAVMKGMAVAGQQVLGQAVKHRFTGKGPFPTSQHRLGVVTNRLRKSLRVTPPQVSGDRRTVSIRFGSDVSYYALHEFGFTGRVQVRGHTRRAVASGALSPKGKVTKGEINSRKNSILVKGRNNFSYVKPHTRNLTIAARAPLGTQLSDRSTPETFFRQIGRELRLELSNLRKGGLT